MSRFKIAPKYRPAKRIIIPPLIRIEVLKEGDEPEKSFPIVTCNMLVPNAGDMIVIGDARDAANVYRVTEKINYLERQKALVSIRLVIRPILTAEDEDDHPEFANNDQVVGAESQSLT
jgi:hypothetical protein